MTTTRRGRYLAAAILVAALAGCSNSSSHPAAAPTTAGSSTATVAPALAAQQLDAVRTNVLAVLDDFERDGAAAKTGKPKKDYGESMAKYYADAAAMARFHGSGGIGAPIGCGKASGKTVVDGAIIGTPAASGAGITVPVSLYTGTTGAAHLSVTADATGKLSGFVCQPPATPDLPGAAVLVGFYGGAAAVATDPNADDKIAALKDQFVAPAFAKFTRTDVEADEATCAEGTFTFWHAVYDPAATATGAQWYFHAGGQNQVNMSVAVDPAANHVAWVYCFGQLPVPLTPGGAYSDTQVQSFVSDLFNDYAYLQALKPFGADTSGMKAYFVSDAAYQTAAATTGAQPLECSSTAATSIGADTITVAGGTAIVDLTSSPSGHPVTSGALGHPKVTVDMATLKLKSVACG